MATRRNSSKPHTLAQRVTIRRARGATYQEISLEEKIHEGEARDLAPFEGIPGAFELRDEMQQAIEDADPAKLRRAAAVLGLDFASVLQAANEGLVANKYILNNATKQMQAVEDAATRLKAARLVAELLGFLQRVEQAPPVPRVNLHLTLDEADQLQRLTGRSDIVEHVKVIEGTVEPVAQGQGDED